MNGILLLVFGAAVGVLSGLLGIGGGVVLVPGLILLFGFSQSEAQGTSLAVMIPPIGIFAAAVYYQHGYVRLPIVGLIALGFMLGALLGAKLVPHLPLELLRVAFGVLLLYLGFAFVMGAKGVPAVTSIAVLLTSLVASVFAYFAGRKPCTARPLNMNSVEDDFTI